LIFEYARKYSSTNAAGHQLIFAQNTSTVKKNITTKRSAQNAGNGIAGPRISKVFWGRLPSPLWKTSTPCKIRPDLPLLSKAECWCSVG
jgi:hypothetical protein